MLLNLADRLPIQSQRRPHLVRLTPEESHQIHVPLLFATQPLHRARRMRPTRRRIRPVSMIMELDRQLQILDRAEYPPAVIRVFAVDIFELFRRDARGVHTAFYGIQAVL